MATDNPSNLAVLIDGDNVTPKIIGGLMAEIANYGTASVRRIYGDWTQPNLKGWKDCLLAYSISPMQQFAYTSGKNATDGAMIIDAMDLIYTGRFSSFCLVSSDSDFTRLAARIREQGVTVYGFGERKTNNAFIAACDKFVYFDVLSLPPSTHDEPSSALQASPSRTGTTVGSTQPATHASKLPNPTMALSPAALMAIEQAIANSIGVDGVWANLADVGQRLTRSAPDINARNYGYARLRDFIEASGRVESRSVKLDGKPSVAYVRLTNGSGAYRT